MTNIIQNLTIKSLDGIRTRDRRIKGVDESTERKRPPQVNLLLLKSSMVRLISQTDWLDCHFSSMSRAWLLPVTVIRLHVGDLHAVGWGEGLWALVTPVKAIRVGVRLCGKKVLLVKRWLRVRASALLFFPSFSLVKEWKVISRIKIWNHYCLGSNLQRLKIKASAERYN